MLHMVGWAFDCPMCSPNSGKFKLGINLRSLKATCWTCGYARLGDVLAAASGRPLREVLSYLPQGLQTPVRREERPQGKYLPPNGIGPLLTEHKEYLRKRGFDPDELVRLWGIGGLGPRAEYPWRLFIPVTRDGQGVSWTTRAIGNGSGVRYLSAPPEREVIPRNTTLYGIDHVRHAAIMVEGPADAWAIGPGAVATFGVGVTAAQAALLTQIPVRVVCFDNEPAAQRRARQLADQLALHPGVTYVVKLSGKDPAESPKEEIEEIREKFLN